ncbi:hypothetical protein Q9R32_07030 [Actinotalea sp. AC32]|nr:hypothetical protein [Actinotalea sp. AC32]
MNRIATTLVAAAVTLGLALAGVPALASGPGTVSPQTIGSTGCCKQ